jgi:hypothetical protein
LLLLVCIVGAGERQPQRRVGRGNGDRSEWVMKRVTDFYRDMTGECSSMPAALSYSQRPELHMQAARGFAPLQRTQEGYNPWVEFRKNVVKNVMSSSTREIAAARPKSASRNPRRCRGRQHKRLGAAAAGRRTPAAGLSHTAVRRCGSWYAAGPFAGAFASGWAKTCRCHLQPQVTVRRTSVVRSSPTQPSRLKHSCSTQRAAVGCCVWAS